MLRRLFLYFYLFLLVACGGQDVVPVTPEPTTAVINPDPTLPVAESTDAATTLPTATTEPAVVAASGTPATALAWLLDTHQNSDSGFSSFSLIKDYEPSDIAGTVKVLFGILAVDPSAATAPLVYLEANGAALATYAQENMGNAGRLVMVLSAAGADPTAFAGQDFVAILGESYANTMTNAVLLEEYDQALALMGFRVAGVEPPANAIQALVERQNANGSWGYQGNKEDVEGTAMAMMALFAYDANSMSALKGIDYLRSVQLPSGGWEAYAGSGQNATSTALAMQALAVAGEDVSSTGSPWQRDMTPMAVLQSYQLPTGSFGLDLEGTLYDDFDTTVQVMPAFAGKTLPLH
jgi:squalene cyclase